MEPGLFDVHTEIKRIDRAIDANRDELFRRCNFKRGASPAIWQAAWDRHPDLSLIEQDLFRQRGEMQLVRDRLSA